MNLQKANENVTGIFQDGHQNTILALLSLSYRHGIMGLEINFKEPHAQQSGRK